MQNCCCTGIGVIERNTTIPTKKSQIFSTAQDNQPSVDIHVLQGERDIASANKTLARFELTGIPPAPRGIPQIEVTFDIDANGIVHVSAKDLGTNKEQHVTITASSNLTEDQINDAIKDAEKFAEEDKKRKEVVDAKNHADIMVGSIEKVLSENGDKISEEEKEALNKHIEEVKEAAKGDNIDDIKAKTAELEKISGEVFTKLYQQTAGAGTADATRAAEGTGTAGNNDSGGAAEGTGAAGNTEDEEAGIYSDIIAEYRDMVQNNFYQDLLEKEDLLACEADGSIPIFERFDPDEP